MESAKSDVEAWYEEQRGAAVVNYGTAVGYWQARLDVMGDLGLSATVRFRLTSCPAGLSAHRNSFRNSTPAAAWRSSPPSAICSF